MKNQEIDKEAQWQDHIKQWSTSGLSQAEYCRVHNLSSRQFRYYKIKFEQRDKSDGDLVELKNVKYRQNTFIELVTPDGLLLRFREDISPAHFRNMIMSLRG